MILDDKSFFEGKIVHDMTGKVIDEYLVI